MELGRELCSSDVLGRTVGCQAVAISSGDAESKKNALNGADVERFEDMRHMPNLFSLLRGKRLCCVLFMTVGVFGP